MDSLVISRVPLDALHLDPANARQHGERNLEAIRASLASWPNLVCSRSRTSAVSYSSELSEDEYTRLVRKYFDPVALRLGLSGPQFLEYNMEFYGEYFGPRLGLQVNVDRTNWFAPYMTVFIHTNGKSPPDYIDDYGRTVRIPLGEVADRLGGDRAAFQSLREMYKNRTAPEIIAKLAAQTAEDLWPLIEANAVELFGEA